MAAINSQQTRARKCSGVAEVAWSAPLVPRPRHRPALLTLFWGPVVSRPAHAEQPANGATLQGPELQDIKVTLLQGH